MKIYRLLVGFGLIGAFCAGSAIAESPPDHAEKTKAADPTIAVDLKACKFFESRSHMPFVPKDWGMLATGARYFGRHAAFAKLTELDYERSPVGVVDSGLQIANHPLAGGPDNPNVKRSPEVDEMGHGTAVYSVIAGPNGVDPRLRVRPFKVTVSVSDYPPTRGKLDLDHASIINQIDAALDDDAVKVINASLVLRSPPSPVIEAMFRKALKKRKFLVFAAGNDTEVGNTWRRAYPELTNNPYLLFVGATSYLGTPSSFSNFGPGVDIFAPGSHIDTLDRAASPFTKREGDFDPVDGTSFAAPQVAGIVGKLRLRFPTLSPTALRQAMKLGAVYRGEKSRVPQINALHLVDVLTRAEGCLGKAGDDATLVSTCLDEADRAMQAAVEFPIKPAAKKCGEWEVYFDKLVENFFLTKGSAAYARAIHAFLVAAGKENIAEHLLFGASTREGDAASAPLLKRLAALKDAPGFKRDEYKHELEFAQKFLANGWEEKISVATMAGEASRLWNEGKKNEALDRVFAACGEHFQGRPRSGCVSAVLALPPAMLDPLATRLLATKGRFTPINEAVSYHTERPAYMAFVARLLPRFAAQCEVEPKDCNNAHLFASFFPQATPEGREAALESLRRVAAKFAKDDYLGRTIHGSYATGLSHVARALTAEEEKAVRAEFVPDTKSGPGEIALLTARYGAGQAKAKQVIDALRGVITGEGDRGWLGFDFNRLLSRFGALGVEAADALADLFLEEAVAKAAKTRGLFGRDVYPLTPWIAKMTPAKAGAFLDTVLEHLASAESDDPGKAALDLLQANRDVPRARDILAEIARGPQKQASRQQVRRAYLEAQAQLATKLTPDVQAFLEEGSGTRASRIQQLRPDVVFGTPALAKELPRDESFVRWLRYGAEKSGPAISRWLAAQDEAGLGTLLKALPRDSQLELLSLPSLLRDKGRAGDVSVGPLLTAGISVLAAEGKKISPDDRKELLARLLPLGRREAGLVALNAAPKSVSKLADAIRLADPLPSEQAVPEPVAAALRAALPMPKADWDGVLPAWGWHLFATDPGTLDIALVYLTAAEGQPKAAARVAGAIQDMLRSNPSVYRELMRRRDYADIVDRVRRASR